MSGPRPVTVALVLGAAVWPGGEPSPTLRRRALHGAALILGGKADYLIGCGGIGRHSPSEAEVICRLCREAGVPADALRAEAASTTTEANITLALPILRELRADQVILVTDHYHAPRARWIARRLGLRATSSSPAASGTKRRRLAYSYAREGLALLRMALWPGKRR